MDRIDVFAAARKRSQWEGRLPFAAMPRLAASLLLDEPAGGAGVLDYRCRGDVDAQGRPALTLWLDGVVPLRCDRCGKKLALALRVERRFYFVGSGAELAAIPVDDATDEPLLGSVQFDLAGLIEDEAILQLPLSPRHVDCVPVALARPPDKGFASTGGELAAVPERLHPFAGLARLRDRLPKSGAGSSERPRAAGKVPAPGPPDAQPLPVRAPGPPNSPNSPNPPAARPRGRKRPPAGS
jgi:uncharacterized protein